LNDIAWRRFKLDTTMKSFSGLFFICTLASGWGCTSTSPQPEVSQFSFFYEGREYSIYSIRSIQDQPANYLLSRDGNTVVLRAKDGDLDGVLDTLMLGSISFEKANAIYASGISQAVRSGKYATSEPFSVYVRDLMTGGFSSIQTYDQAAGATYNVFTVRDVEQGIYAVFVDVHADGTLDRIESGTADLEVIQMLYESVLTEGLQSGRLVRIGGAFIVQDAEGA
jgi:hypothetical protein